MIHEYVQYGCGLSAPENWLNFDASPTLIFERIPLLGRFYTRNAERFPKSVRFGDIVKGLPIPPGSCKGIYCSHVLEHLSLDDCDQAIRNTWVSLAPGGIFRFVLPDLERLCRSYIEDRSVEANSRFMEESYLGTKRRTRGLRGFATAWLGNGAHLWMWDEKGLAERLREHGFRDVRRASFGDCEDPRFNEVESEVRFTGHLAMQCRK